MPLRDNLLRVLTEYPAATKEAFAKHPFADFIRHELRNTVAEVAQEYEQVTVKASPGMGNWSRGPWIALLDTLITDTPQRGYYPVYLYREDMAGVYLSLNQGMTALKEQYKADAKTTLKARAANFRAMLGSQLGPFMSSSIDLAPGAPGNDTAFYEAGNICARYYPREWLEQVSIDNPPNGQLAIEDVLIGDLLTMLQLYNNLSQADTEENTETAPEGDAPPLAGIEDATKFRLHKRIERNAKLATAVKKAQGYTCKICHANFEQRYGSIGQGYIEAHHLKPLALLKGQKVALDPLTDFAVLCANCHRMIHRSGCVDDIEKFKREHFRE